MGKQIVHDLNPSSGQADKPASYVPAGPGTGSMTASGPGEDGLQRERQEKEHSSEQTAQHETTSPAETSTTASPEAASTTAPSAAAHTATAPAATSATVVPVSAPKEGEILVKVEACGICFSDFAVIQGEFGPLSKKDLIPGHEVIGRVVDVGPGVKRWQKGDRVGGGWH